jgi:hypothetical protein
MQATLPAARHLMPEPVAADRHASFSASPGGRGDPRRRHGRRHDRRTDRYTAAALHIRLLDYEGSAYCLSGLAGLALGQDKVAQLADVSVDYYSRPEQGRNLRASAEVLDSVSRTRQA